MAEFPIIATTVPDGTCFESVKVLIEQQAPNYLSVNIPGAVEYLVQNSQPSVDDQDKLWLQTSASGDPLEQKIYNNGWKSFKWVDDAARVTAIAASSAAAGTPGETAYDGSYFYVCNASNQWRRIALGGAY